MAAKAAKRSGSRRRTCVRNPERDPGRVQFAARNTAGVQLSSAPRLVRRLSAAIAALDRARPLARSPTPAPIVDRIKSAGVIRCGGVPRPGLVGQSPDGHAAAGLYLDLCRAIGAALLGPEGRIEFRPYDSDKRIRARRATARTIFPFSTARRSPIIASPARRRSGPPVYFVVDRGDGPRRLRPSSRLSDLAGKSICFYQGDERASAS